MKQRFQAFAILLSITLSCASPWNLSSQEKQPAPQGQQNQHGQTRKGEGQACNVAHAAKTQGCRPLTDDPKPRWYVIVREGAFKECGPSNEPGQKCTERLKATHTIEVYKDAACTQLLKKIAVDQARCD